MGVLSMKFKKQQNSRLTVVSVATCKQKDVGVLVLKSESPNGSVTAGVYVVFNTDRAYGALELTEIIESGVDVKALKVLTFSKNQYGYINQNYTDELDTIDHSAEMDTVFEFGEYDDDKMTAVVELQKDAYEFKTYIDYLTQFLSTLNSFEEKDTEALKSMITLGYHTVLYA